MDNGAVVGMLFLGEHPPGDLGDVALRVIERCSFWRTPERRLDERQGQRRVGGTGTVAVGSCSEPRVEDVASSAAAQAHDLLGHQPGGRVQPLAVGQRAASAPPAAPTPGFVVGDVEQLAFRLWEVKKRDGSGSVSASIRNGYIQLGLNAERYLAKLTAQSEAPDSEAELVDFLANLVPAWKQADPSSGAGIAVAADATGLPGRAFTTMHRHFPALVDAGGIEGCLVGLGSLREFTSFVRTLLWNGLSTATT